MKNKILVFFLLIFLLTSCNNKPIDKEQYGVRYSLNDNEWLTIKLDPENNNVVTAMICVMKDAYNAQIEPLVIGNINDDKKDTPLIYIYSKDFDDNYNEYLVINFEENDLSLYQEVIDFIGISKEYEDNVITYTELMTCDTFRYQKFFEYGTFENNISFANEDIYNVPSK